MTVRTEWRMRDSKLARRMCAMALGTTLTFRSQNMKE